MTTAFFTFQMFLLLIAPMMLMAGLFAAWRYREKRQNQRRSPLSESLLRAPGESLFHEFRRTNDVIDESFVMVMLAPAILIGVWGFYQTQGKTIPLWIPVILVLSAVGWSLRRMIMISRKRESLRLGYEAERAVAQNLNELIRDG